MADGEAAELFREYIRVLKKRAVRFDPKALHVWYYVQEEGGPRLKKVSLDLGDVMSGRSFDDLFVEKLGKDLALSAPASLSADARKRGLDYFCVQALRYP